MARTIDPVGHAVRRDAFVDAAQRLIGARGYEQMSVADVIDEVGASKGAFYHYFDSKAALLDALVERMVEDAVARYGPTVADPTVPAVAKFAGLFGSIAELKAERRELILGALQSWLSEDNAVVREHLRRGLVARLGPLLGDIVRQGVAEGAFTSAAPDATARVLVSLMLGMNEDATGLFFALDDGSISLDEFQHRVGAYVDAFERVLGVPSGTLVLGDPDLVRRWQAWFHDYRKD
jgi:AcrR family transcriptional regulator